MESPRPFRRLLGILFDRQSLSVTLSLLSVGLLATGFGPLLTPGLAFSWLGVSLVLAVSWFVLQWHAELPLPTASQRTLSALAVVLVLALAASYSWFLSMVFPLADPTGQMTLAWYSVGLICVGTFANANRTWRAAAWMAGVLSGLVVTLFMNRRIDEPYEVVLLLAVAAAVVWVTIAYRQNVLARVTAEAKAANQSQLIGLLLHDFEEGAQDWIWETDAQGHLRSVSFRFAEELGRPAADLDGHRFVDVLVHDLTRLTVEDEEDLGVLSEHLAGTRAFRDIEVPAQIGGVSRRWRLSAKPFLSANDVVEGWRGVGTDVTEVQRLNNLNARLALLDGLTGLANRHRFMTVLHDRLTPRDEHSACSLILIDLQGFRIVNDGLGHELGDDLLKEVTARLRSRVPSSSLLARMGGDEFAILAPSAEPDALEGLVAALKSSFENPFLVHGDRLEIGVHTGIAVAPRDANDAPGLLKCAELALHEAKATRLGSPVVYQSEYGQRAHDRIRLQRELKLALHEGQFELHFQPQISLTTGAMVGAEALVRWRHPERGMVSPAEFIPALEETGLIVPVGLWILKSSCLEALTWLPEQKVAVNVSAVQFASRTFLDSVREIMESTGMPPHRLELEITESVMAQDPRQVIQVLNDLRHLGISISLDDFGTGYSSLSYLRQLPLDKLKVDQSFVRVLGKDANADAIVRTVLELSHQLGLATTAEGVETEAQRDMLAALGVDNVQGYLYSKPLPIPALKEFREAPRA